MRLIDAEALWTQLLQVSTEEELRSKYDVVEGIDKTLHCISMAPTIEAKPVVHAHWISEDEAEELGHLEWSYGCSNCKEIFWDCTESFAFSYCPHCGAQMDELVSNTNKLNCSEKPDSCDHIAEVGKKEGE